MDRLHGLPRTNPHRPSFSTGKAFFHTLSNLIRLSSGLQGSPLLTSFSGSSSFTPLQCRLFTSAIDLPDLSSVCEPRTCPTRTTAPEGREIIPHGPHPPKTIPCKETRGIKLRFAPSLNPGSAGIGTVLEPPGTLRLTLGGIPKSPVVSLTGSSSAKPLSGSNSFKHTFRFHPCGTFVC